MAKTRFDYAKAYLDETAEIAKTIRVLTRMASQGKTEWHGNVLKERLDDYSEVLRETEDRIASMEKFESYALICRYVYLMDDKEMQRALGFSRATCYRLLSRGTDMLYDYLPTEYKRGKS